MMTRLIHICLALALGLQLAAVRPVRAQETANGASYITPFPEGDIYKLHVIGDGLADGALSGLV
jgi:uncharacterized protein